MSRLLLNYRKQVKYGYNTTRLCDGSS
jgi:hypothetical protein